MAVDDAGHAIRVSSIEDSIGIRIVLASARSTPVGALRTLVLFPIVRPADFLGVLIANPPLARFVAAATIVIGTSTPIAVLTPIST